jgi:crotonobetainyl-CoA:carnitine CoA-transferase CaiB-like acyl-CoA transferase
MVLEQAHPTAGQRRLLGFPLKLSEAPMGIRLPAPMLGEQTEALLTELGYSQTLIEKFQREGVV